MEIDLNDGCVIDTFFELANFSNGFANSAAHMMGYLVHKLIKAGKMKEIASGKMIEMLIESLERKTYLNYRLLLEECGCSLCVSVVQFDDKR